MLVPLYPVGLEPCPLIGAYLKLKLHRQQKLLIYSNYIASMDGRISLPNAQGEQVVPASIANKRDWRLYQELAAQADVMLTSARYFRQLAKGCAQDLLPVGQGDYADLLVWRAEQGLKTQADIVIFSRSLAIPLDSLEPYLAQRNIHIFCPETANKDKCKAFQDIGVQLHIAGKEAVQAKEVRQLLEHLNYRSAYMIAGPEVHRTLLIGKQLDRLFLTQYLSLLGQNNFHSITTDAMEACPMTLESMALDQQEGQVFNQFSFCNTSCA
ncbi:MAG: dihydrofolate reductase family protein [Mariprofundaceae bacterium]|nr:dihydrofolate reductase family protein [Mariprofundaceae bacterium]